MPLYKLQSPFGAATNALSQAAQTSSSMQRKETRRQGDDTLDAIRAGVGIVQGVAGTANSIGNLMHTSQKIEQTGMEMENEKAISAAADEAARLVQENGGDISVLDGSPLMGTLNGMKGAGRFLEQRYTSSDKIKSIAETESKAAEQLYTDLLRPGMIAAQDAYSKGDMGAFGAIVEELSAKAPFPSRYKRDENGNFVRWFRSDKHGGYTPTEDVLTPQRAYEEMKSMMQGEQKVLSGIDMKVRHVNLPLTAQLVKAKLASSMGNAQSLANPIPYQDKNGNTIWVSPQNRIDDYSAGTSYRVLDEKSGHSIMVNSPEELSERFPGFVPADKRTALDKSRADVRASNARAQAYERAGAKGGGAVTLSDRDRSILMKYSENEDGETDHGKAALLEAISMKTGMTPLAAIHSYDSSVKNAMTKGLSRADAERAVYSEYAKRLGGGGEQPSRKGEESKPQAQPQDKTAERAGNAVNRKPDDQPQKPAAGIMLDPDVSAALEEDELLYGY